MKSSEVSVITVTSQVLGNATPRLSTSVRLFRLTLPKFSRLNSNVTFALPSASNSVCTLRFATPITGFCTNDTGVPLISSGLLSLSTPSGSDPFTDASVTRVPLGEVPLVVAVFVKEV